MSVADLRHFDDDARKEDIGKVAQVIGKVISSKPVAKNETKFGSHFIHLIGKVGPDGKSAPSISCYTWGYPSLKEGQIVRLTGNITSGAAIGYALMNCHVEKR